ncbi:MULTISPECIES: phosphoribosylanthranilate isomerase [Streptococcus]|uniref:phosphoribosylanthranilate isomerase n=1 Tax=Streptococcus TaxID=1301 RepID=UPI0022844CE1|nr:MULTISPECIES: phosphoribosylanthranilate isomerase [Streptococcus]MCY7024367.1 phosphoribosylanthranilate isomerase [Streptococcus sanguinis]MDQ8692864.1 phosphoribosylanthranilate isomerase [Streptococcus sp. IsoGale022]
MTKVKICGLSTASAVETACKAGADYIGFVFAESRRRVSLEQAQKLAALVPSPVRKVGVFVSPSLTELEEAISVANLDLVQIHGDFDEELLTQVGRPVIRAYQVSGALKDVSQQSDYLLFDAPLAGSGQTFDWQVFDRSQINQPFFIAGGLNAGNVREAIQHFAPHAVDVSSGVETDGQKDLEKITEFIERVKYGI